MFSEQAFGEHLLAFGVVVSWEGRGGIIRWRDIPFAFSASWLRLCTFTYFTLRLNSACLPIFQEDLLRRAILIFCVTINSRCEKALANPWFSLHFSAALSGVEGMDK